LTQSGALAQAMNFATIQPKLSQYCFIAVRKRSCAYRKPKSARNGDEVRRGTAFTIDY
jgi:hypothetical protein